MTDPKTAQDGNSRAERLESSRLALRNQLWPQADPALLWSRKRAKGFATVPRTLPLILLIMDRLNIGKPVSSTYLDLFCRCYDESFVRLDKVREMAFSSGFITARGHHTWAERLDQLKRDGFIAIAPGQFGTRSFALIYNPYLVIKHLHQQGKIDPALYNALASHAASFGAKDLELDICPDSSKERTPKRRSSFRPPSHTASHTLHGSVV